MRIETKKLKHNCARSYEIFNGVEKEGHPECFIHHQRLVIYFIEMLMAHTCACTNKRSMHHCPVRYISNDATSLDLLQPRVCKKTHDK